MGTGKDLSDEPLPICCVCGGEIEEYAIEDNITNELYCLPCFFDSVHNNPNRVKRPIENQ
jgi:hypothetical protein